jgi:hypothetical protein
MVTNNVTPNTTKNLVKKFIAFMMDNLGSSKFQNTVNT